MEEQQKFYDINQFPPEEGMVVFGISMSKMSNAQRAEKYFEYLEHLLKKIAKTEGIGATILYSDYLYMYTDIGAPAELRKKYLESMLQHKNSFLKVLRRRADLIPKAYTFLTYGQLLIGSRDFTHYFSQLKEIYRNDSNLQKYVAFDSQGKDLNENQINFILEESLVFYLISKGYFSFANDYIQHREKWVLNCYPGKPLATETYLYQQNFFELSNPKNKYENCFYDLEEKVLYDLQKVNIEELVSK